MRCGLLDQILTPAAGNVETPGVLQVCFDNGIYSNAYPGDNQYLRYLDKKAPRTRCAFAVAPDVVADHGATFERSWPMLRRIREIGLPVAFCTQNGAAVDDMPWEYIDVVFLAGIVECVPCAFVPRIIDTTPGQPNYCPAGHLMTEWKIGDVAQAITAEAKRRGLRVHMGRVNTRGRLLHAKAIGVDSCDGTFLAYGPDVNLPRLLTWLSELPELLPLAPAEVEADLTLFDAMRRD